MSAKGSAKADKGGSLLKSGGMKDIERAAV
jgi:hypothetical protein